MNFPIVEKLATVLFVCLIIAAILVAVSIGLSPLLIAGVWAMGFITFVVYVLGTGRTGY